MISFLKQRGAMATAVQCSSLVVSIDGNSLSLLQLQEVALHKAGVCLNPAALSMIQRSRAIVEEIVSSDDLVYSINTGFGALSSIAIPKADVDTLQLNFVRSHAAGTGEPLSREITRGMMLLRANTLAKGYSGVRPEVIQLLLDMLNTGVHPVIPCKGSLGASGDLAPLAHLALVLIGEGFAEWEGKIYPGGEALEKVGLSPVILKAKEGLALVNGTQMMTAIGALNVLQAENLCKVADISGAMSIEGFMGSHRPFMEMVQHVRPHPGQISCAENFRRLLNRSEIAESHAGCKKVQDPYSFRCIAQVHGAVRDTVAFVRQVIEREMNAATDNPLIFPETHETVSQGNFHGEPVALAMDYLGIALAELGNIAERRIDKLNDPHFSELPAFLTQGREGLNSGTMIVHYTAASLVSENKVLAHPASVDSIPSSNNKEDHVSMGSIAARKALQIIEHVQTILAAELYCATQALRFRSMKPGEGVEAAFRFMSERIQPIIEDRVFAPEVDEVSGWIADTSLLQAVESKIGGLK
jgi:histidine ammonia-lyase